MADDKPFYGPGFEQPIRTLSGAHAIRVVHPGECQIEEHAHDAAVLTLSVLGAATEEFDGGHVRLSGVGALYQPPGEAHRDTLHSRDIEVLVLEFDPAWLRRAGLRLDRPLSWSGGAARAGARRLADLWRSPRVRPDALERETLAFLANDANGHAGPRPRWLRDAEALLAAGSTTAQIARRLDISPHWLSQSYRIWTGEGLRAAALRLRVEEAVHLLRRTTLRLPDIAVGCGFCDQSHMNRVFGRLLGRTPVEVRSERSLLQPFSSEQPNPFRSP